jgi:tetratricopeptide (TPR) repeat protein
MNTEIWDRLFGQLPDINAIPVREIAFLIKYCLDPRVEDFDLAITLLDKLSHLRNDVEFLNWKAMVEFEAKKYVRSLHTSEQILTVVDNAFTNFNAGRVAYKANELLKSKTYLERAMELDPTDYAAKLDHAVTVCSLGDIDGAFELINSINANDAHTAQILEFNKGWHYIRRGDFKRGMALLHIGRSINIWGSHARRYSRPQWDGSTQEGKTILIAGEGGIGDELINARFSKNIKERGMRAIMCTQHGNESMLSSVPWLDAVISPADIDKTSWDYWVPCMDIPYTMSLDIDDIYSQPYIFNKPEYVDKWAPKVASDRLKVGIRWSGNPRYELELGRTIPTQYFESLRNEHIQLYSLQKNDGQADFKSPHGVVDLASGFNSWDDTLGAIHHLDLVITSCTSIAHAAAALGKRTWIVTPLLPYYTWADMKKSSYWYDSASLYRQKRWNDWSDPFAEINRDLQHLLGLK